MVVGGLGLDDTHTVITAFVCTIVVLTIATMFLSCFGKKKGDKGKKKDKKNKKNAPTAPPDTKDTNTTPAITVTDNHSKGGTADDNIQEQSKDFVDTNDGLGDFSAVRETEVLRSGSNDELFNPDSSAQSQSFDSSDNNRISQDGGKVNDSKPKPAAVEEDDKSKKRGSSQDRSSMLDEINNTLASIHSETTSATSNEITTVVEKKAEEVQEEMMAANMANTVNAQIEKEIEAVNEVEKDTDTSELKSDVTATEEVVDKAAISVSSVADKVNEAVENKDEEVAEEKVKLEDKINGLKETVEEKSDRVEKEAENHLSAQDEAIVTEQAEGIVIGQIDLKIEENGDDKQEESEAIPASDNDSGIKDVELEAPINHHLGEGVTEATSPKDEKVKERLSSEVKIPPKVSPKPSPKNRPRNVSGVNHNLPAESPTSHNSEEDPSSPKMIEEEIKQLESAIAAESTNGESHNKTDNVDSPPPTPTSPTTKGQSRIPMSKKASGIPKLSFTPTTKSSSASPLSSPDSTTKRLNQIEDAAHIVIKEADKSDADLKTTNHDTPSSPVTEPAESDLNNSNTKESSPFNEENRNSKRTKLTKLRYSGRKKSSESKSDESGSERGSRAGSEAKSDDGKKTAEDLELEKNSRIPVRGGSKPRSSPPKTLGNQ